MKTLAILATLTLAACGGMNDADLRGEWTIEIGEPEPYHGAPFGPCKGKMVLDKDTGADAFVGTWECTDGFGATINGDANLQTPGSKLQGDFSRPRTGSLPGATAHPYGDVHGDDIAGGKIQNGDFFGNSFKAHRTKKP